MARIVEEDYAYATARIRAIENKMLTPQRLERLIEAPTADDAVKILTELGYGSGGTDGAPNAANAYEGLLSYEMKKVYELLEKIMPLPGITALFKRRSDYLNAKTVLKAEFLGNETPAMLSNAGNIEPALLSRTISERKLADIPEILGRAVLESVEEYGRSSDPQEIDFILDKAMYANMKKDARDLGDPYVAELVGMLEDTANIRIFIRAKFLKKSSDFLAQSLMEGYSIPKKIYLDNADKALDSFFDSLRFTPASDFTGKLRELVKNGQDISGVEKFLDNRLMEYVRKSKYVAMGVQPVVAYLFFKEAEIRNVRLIITGKINKISQAAIRERLRAGYA